MTYGFPFQFEDELESPILIADSLPYEDREIVDYLEWCHTHYRLDKPIAGFTVSNKSPDSVIRDGRLYWLIEAQNDLGEKWLVVAGSGASPFDQSKMMSRWMHAVQFNNDSTADELFASALAEQEQHDRSSGAVA